MSCGVRSAMLDPLWPLHEAADTKIFREGSPVWGFPSMGESGRDRISDVSSFDPPKMQRIFFLSKDCVTNHDPLEKTLFPLPTSITFHVITHFSSLEAQTQTCKSTFHFLWSCFTALSPFAVFITKISLD